MLLPDVNILVYAQREDLPAHRSARSWLESVLNGAEPVGLFDPTLASFLRIVTNRRIFKIPTPLSMALSFVETMRAAATARPVNAGARHWEIFARLCRDTKTPKVMMCLTPTLPRSRLKTIASSSAPTAALSVFPI